MSSFSVLYNGQRKTIKASPSALMQSVIIEAAEKFELDPNKCSLYHKKIMIDRTQPVRFCSIPNLAQLDLQFNESLKATSSAVPAQCRIAMSVMNGTSCTGTFPAGTTVIGMLQAFVGQGSLPTSLMSGSYEVIYLRTTITGDSLQSTSLGDLGLAGQGGRLQFRNTSVPAHVLSIIKADPSIISDTDITVISQTVEIEMETDSGDREGIEENDIKSIVDSMAHSTYNVENCDTADRELLLPSIMQLEESSSTPSHLSVAATVLSPSNNDLNQEVSSKTANEIRSMSTTEITNSSDPEATVMISELEESTWPKIKQAIIKKTPLITSTCIKYLLTENFDSVSTPCILTIVKYVLNILSDPSQSKYRMINVTNKTFQEKVMKANGSSELISSIGFVEVPGTSSLKNASSVDIITDTLRLLEEAMDSLQIPLGDRPKMKVIVPVSVSETPVVEWDPYKSVIVRTAPQPSRGGKSVTEVALEQLHAHRRKLEGTIDSVARRTEVLLPLQDGSIASMQDYLNANNSASVEGDIGAGLGTNTRGKSSGGSTHDDEEYSGPSDSTLIARSLASKMRGGSGRNDEDDEPMTTAAVRELRKLQKEKVYSYTLIRIKFPDRVCLQGYFHLRHTILDVYEWVRSCLSVEEEGEGEGEGKECSGDMKKNPSGSDFFRLFELYTSPPRCVLHPYAKSSSEAEPDTSVHPGSPLVVRYLPLIEAHLVPAALIHLAWGPDHDEHKDNLKIKGISSSSSASASASSASICENSNDENNIDGNSNDGNSFQQDNALGRYLSSATLSLVRSNDSKGDSSSSVYPSGSHLSSEMSPKLIESVVSNSSSIVSGAAVHKTESTNDRTPNNENKPKWLKIGK